MNVIKMLINPESGGERRPKRKRKGLLLGLVDLVLSLPLEALKAKWERDRWDPGK